MTHFFRNFFCIMVVWTSVIEAAPETIDVLMVAYDMGDTGPLKQVMQQFDQQKISYRVVAVGKASEELKDYPTLLNLEDFPNNDLKAWSREKLFDGNIIKKLQEKVSPKIVITGMASAVQAQLINGFKSQGSYTMAFYDNFDPIIDKEYVQPFLKEIQAVDAYLIPAQPTLESFKVHEKTKGAQLKVVGQPALQVWDEIFKDTDRKALREALGLNDQDQVVLFVGGYDTTYQDFFACFVEGAKNFEAHPNIKFFVTYHPKTEGELEKQIIQEKKATNIHVIEKTGPSTQQMATLANVIVCHKSNVGMQALYKRIPVIYLVKKGDYSNFALDQGLAKQVETSTDFVQTLALTLKAANQNNADFSQKMGIPENATQTIVDCVKEALSKKKAA